MWGARARLASLWGSQTARVLADNALRLLVVLDYARNGIAERESAWHIVTALLMLPAVVLAPLNGALCNSLAKPNVLRGACGYVVVVLVGCIVLGAPLLIGWSLIAIGSAIYAPARSALLPAGSEDAHLSLPRVNSLFEMAAAAAVVGGLMLTAQWHEDARWHDLPPPVPWIIGSYSVALVGALPVWFAGDVRRPESAGRAIAGFFRDVARVWREREARWCLFGLASLRGLITGMTGALLAAMMERDGLEFDLLILIGGAVIAGVALGSLLAGFQKHPRRVLGLVPWGATGLTVGLIIAAAGGVPTRTLCVILGAMGGLVNVPLAATYQADVPPDSRGNAMAVRNFADNVLIALMSFVLFALAHWAGWGATAQLALVAVLAGLLALASWWFLRREVVELILEGPFTVMYRFRVHGPGADAFPLRGPVLVIANHACWMDPLFLGKMAPRTLFPMMTSNFYDLPGVRWFMVHIFRAIRVEAGRVRREVPELDEAIQRLDEGRCVVVFPEGRMRRHEEMPLRHFGQGIWHILKARPQTPVVVCWIEGNWGSYFSHRGGPPTRNKKLDLRRPIDIVVSAPHTLPPEVLADHPATRGRLMRECLALRGDLGLADIHTPAEDAGETTS